MSFCSLIIFLFGSLNSILCPLSSTAALPLSPLFLSHRHSCLSSLCVSRHRLNAASITVESFDAAAVSEDTFVDLLIFVYGYAWQRFIVLFFCGYFFIPS